MLHKTTYMDFVANLLTQLSDKDNSVICPHGIAAVLSMVAEGTDGKNLREILTCLGFDSQAALRLAVLTTIKDPCAAFESKNAVTLPAANSIALCRRFERVLTKEYEAMVYREESVGDAAVQICNLANFKAEWLAEMERDVTGKNSFHNADGSFSDPAFLS